MTHFSATADFGHPDADVKPTPGGNGVHITFPNGWTVSVQWGPGTYSSNYDMAISYPYPDMDAETAEIAAWKHDDDNMIVWPYPNFDTVKGWQTWSDVEKVLDLAAGDALPPATTGQP